MQADLNRLRVFYHIYRNLSITAAAGELGITPSAVSQQLKKLEQEIETPLFTRMHKRLVPTPAGKRLFTLAEPLIRDLKSGLAIMAEERGEPSGLLRIGAPMEFGSIYLPHVFASFRARYDKVIFNLELGRPSSLLPMVNSGELDFALVDTFPTKQQHYSDFGTFSVEPVIEEKVVLACSRKFSENHLSTHPSYNELIASTFVSQQQDSQALNNWFLHHFRKTPAKLNIVLTVSNHQAVVASISQHMGLGIVVNHLVWDDIQSGKIIVLREMEQQAVNRISLVQLPDKIPTLTEKTFLKHFHAVTRKSKTLQRLDLAVK